MNQATSGASRQTNITRWRTRAFWRPKSGRNFEVYTQPKDGQYRTRQIFLPGEELEVPGFGLQVAVDELLGPAAER
ncbi:MAG: hypothetical protein NXI25_02345 [bacterium]|nr:hypothetical protein [bacterium]